VGEAFEFYHSLCVSYLRFCAYITVVYHRLYADEADTHGITEIETVMPDANPE
jgi:hypothetical protein